MRCAERGADRVVPEGRNDDSRDAQASHRVRAGRPDRGVEGPARLSSGLYQKVLASDPHEVRKRGSRTRLLRIDAGAFSTEPFVHNHWEKVCLLQVDLIVGNDSAGQGPESFAAPTYACRP